MEEKISVVIPNFNGRDLLAKNLPKVIKNCPNYEIIIVDDGSRDDSVEYLKSRFPKVKIVEIKKNQGFANAVNRGAKVASGRYLLLLNTDVAPQTNFLKSALSYFDEQPNIFAVGLADQSHENGKIVIRGRGGAKFTKGFMSHFALKPRAAETLWVSGGSGMFDRGKFLELGGFDPLFAPFYWEDIDLSYRARKRGLICIFEPDAKVDHYHEEGTIKKTHSSFFIKTISYRNQFIFVWKNINDYVMLTQHLLWLPYHFVKALLTLDFAFFAGFLWACTKIPQLIFNYQLLTTNYQLSDREVLAKFEQ